MGADRLVAMACAAAPAVAQDTGTPDALTEAYQNWVLNCTRIDGADQSFCCMGQQLTRQGGTGQAEPLLSTFLRRNEVGAKVSWPS